MLCHITSGFKMKKQIKDYLQLEKDIESSSYRKLVLSKFILASSFIMLSVAAVGNFFNDNLAIFYVDIALFVILIFLILFPSQQREYTPHIALLTMGIGILTIVYINKGQEYTPIWSFLYIFLVFPLYGHKNGLRVSLLFLGTMLAILFSFVGDTLSSMEFVRFTMGSSFALLLAFLGEMFIGSTFDKLLATKTQLEKLSKTDALTGAYNRRYFDKCLPEKINLINRSESTLALVLIDIDHFKRYNDNFGHPEGDKVLEVLSALLRDHMKRASDAVFRIGGEEFALLYQTKNKQEAKQVIDKIRIAVECLEVQKQELSDHITISAGLYLIDNKMRISADEAYRQADKLLYSAKALGRNQVVTNSETQ